MLILNRMFIAEFLVTFMLVPGFDLLLIYTNSFEYSGYTDHLYAWFEAAGVASHEA